MNIFSSIIILHFVYNTAMKPIGTILMHARKRKGLSVERLHTLTKIRIHHIKAIELNEWDALPGSTYANGFIKRIAEAVDLDPEKVHALFRREYKNNETQKIIPSGMIDAPIGTSNIVLTIRRLMAKLVT
jgi:cytoskeleton protein RodZ